MSQCQLDAGKPLSALCCVVLCLVVLRLLVRTGNTVLGEGCRVCPASPSPCLTSPCLTHSFLPSLLCMTSLLTSQAVLSSREVQSGLEALLNLPHTHTHTHTYIHTLIHMHTRRLQVLPHCFSHQHFLPSFCVVLNLNLPSFIVSTAGSLKYTLTQHTSPQRCVTAARVTYQRERAVPNTAKQLCTQLLC